MTRRRARTDETQKPIVAALRAVGATVRVTSMVGAGFPDLVVWSPFTRTTHFLEVKSSPKGRLTPDEAEFLLEWPGPAAVVVTVEDALRAVGAQQATPRPARRGCARTI